MYYTNISIHWCHPMFGTIWEQVLISDSTLLFDWFQILHFMFDTLFNLTFLSGKYTLKKVSQDVSLSWSFCGLVLFILWISTVFTHPIPQIQVSEHLVLFYSLFLFHVLFRYICLTESNAATRTIMSPSL